MRHADTSSAGGWRWRVVYVLLTTSLLLGIAALVKPLPPAGASHAKDNWKHVSGLHSVSTVEYGCTESHVQDTTLSERTFRTQVRATIRYDEPTKDWHDTAGGRLRFNFYDKRCVDMSSAEITQHKVEYHAGTTDYVESKCPGTPGDRACASGVDCVTDADGHLNCGVYRSFIPYTRLTSTTVARRHVISHETGHFVGLADPGPCKDNSVMHSAYYCTGNANRQFPQPADKATENSIADGNKPNSESTLAADPEPNLSDSTSHVPDLDGP